MRNSNQKQTFSVAGQHMSYITDKIEFEKVNRKTQKAVKFRKGKCDVCGRAKSQIFTK